MVKINSKILLGLPHDLLRAINKEAKRRRTNRTQFIRGLIYRYFQEKEIKEGLADRK